MKAELRSVRSDDLPRVLALNESALPHVSRVALEDMKWFAEHAAYFRVAVAGDRVVAFLIGLTPEADYASENFRWFVANHPSFVYIDRIVVAGEARRRGIGVILYRDVEAFAAGIAPLLTCEVNVRPPNAGSLEFHRRFGFEEVGSQDTEGGTKTVSLLLKKLT